MPHRTDTKRKYQSLGHLRDKTVVLLFATLLSIQFSYRRELTKYSIGFPFQRTSYDAKLIVMCVCRLFKADCVLFQNPLVDKGY